mmetsp:Transcript_27605/g.85835  ORF Transcript_27605/g.85835 Transcript_27605/m.85835 type:complete len:201 (-) Transcript_27605:388-990(-)
MRAALPHWHQQLTRASVWASALTFPASAFSPPRRTCEPLGRNRDGVRLPRPPNPPMGERIPGKQAPEPSASGSESAPAGPSRSFSFASPALRPWRVPLRGPGSAERPRRPPGRHPRARLHPTKKPSSITMTRNPDTNATSRPAIIALLCLSEIMNGSRCPSRVVAWGPRMVISSASFPNVDRNCGSNSQVPSIAFLVRGP